MYTIENNVPVTTVRKPRKIQYPFDKLDINQSFFVPEKGKNMTQVRSLAYAWGKRHGVKLVVRTAIEGGVFGARIWRVA